MGAALVTTQQIACGHTDRGQLRQSLLCDRLSQPTCEMAEALLRLRGGEQGLRQLADAGREDLGRTLLLASMAFCVLLGWRCAREGREGREGRSREEPVQPADFLAAFACKLREPRGFLEELLQFRAQQLPRERLLRLTPLAEEAREAEAERLAALERELRSLGSALGPVDAALGRPAAAGAPEPGTSSLGTLAPPAARRCRDRDRARCSAGLRPEACGCAATSEIFSSSILNLGGC